MKNSKSCLLSACFLVRNSLNSSGGFAASLEWSYSTKALANWFLPTYLSKSLLPTSQEALGYPVNFGLPVFIVCRNQESSVGVNGSAVDL